MSALRLGRGELRMDRVLGRAYGRLSPIESSRIVRDFIRCPYNRNTRTWAHDRVIKVVPQIKAQSH